MRVHVRAHAYACVSVRVPRECECMCVYPPAQGRHHVLRPVPLSVAFAAPQYGMPPPRALQGHAGRPAACQGLAGGGTAALCPPLGPRAKDGGSSAAPKRPTPAAHQRPACSPHAKATAAFICAMASIHDLQVANSMVSPRCWRLPAAASATGPDAPTPLRHCTRFFRTYACMCMCICVRVCVADVCVSIIVCA